MGYASFLVFEALGGPTKRAGRALSIYALQLTLNLSWTSVFFKLHELGLATLVIALLDAAVVGTIAVFSTAIGAQKAWLLLGPYLAWLAYASALTAWIWRNNPPGGRAVATSLAASRPRRANAGKRRVA
jgi:tryptophan-rich sensory protein